MQTDTYQSLKEEHLNDLMTSGHQRATSLAFRKKHLVGRSFKHNTLQPLQPLVYKQFRDCPWYNVVFAITLPIKFSVMDRYGSCYQIGDYMEHARHMENTYKNVTRIRARRTR